MNRRRFIAGSAGLLPALVSGQRPAPAGRPNILILFSDDQRYDTLSILGHPDVKTPNIDRLARRGVTFTHAHIMGGTTGAVCVPTRGMLLTGQSLFHVHDNIIARDAPAARRRPFHLFPEVFSRAGYAAFGTGKWHNGEALYARTFPQGDNIFFGGMSDHTQVPIARFDPTGAYPKEKRSTAKQFSSELFADTVIRFIGEQKGERPFLAYVAFTAPHDPRTPPPRYAEMYPAARMTPPKNFMPEHPFDNGDLKTRDEKLAPWPRTTEVIREHLAAYYGMITHLDAQIGRILEALEASPHARNTIVVFAADNGLAVGQHGLLGKQNVYDHSVRVPLVIAGPGVPQGRRVDRLCYSHDLFPTLCELTGTPVPQTVEFRSLVPLIERRGGGYDSVFMAYRNFQRAVRTERDKLILYNVNGRETTQLFDIRNDPWELENLAGKPSSAGRICRLRALLQDWMHRTDDPVKLDEPNWGQPPARAAHLSRPSPSV